MKKLVFLIVACMCFSFIAKAQDVDDPAYINKRGISLLPQAGAFALGVDATPFLRYFGNFFSRNGSDDLYFNGVDQSIYGKYFLHDDRAIRVKLSVRLMNKAEKGVVPNDEQVVVNPFYSNATVIDVLNTTGADVHLGFGYEYRRGRGRVQGYWGYEFLFGFEYRKDKFDYANPMTGFNQQPSSYNFNGNLDYYTDPYKRCTERKTGNIYSGGLGAFAGVEYFFAPQISIGGELGLRMKYRSEGQTETTWESWNVSVDQLQTKTERMSKNWWKAQTAGLFTNSYGNIFLMFHF